MVDSLTRELQLQKSYLSGEKIETIYFGGGTPSLLTGPELHRIFDALQQHFELAAVPEITLEANPDDLTDETLTTLVEVGVNRLSIGIQSFDDNVLRSLNRVHNGTAARDSVLRAQAKGFGNISIDLIYAIPLQDLERWSENIAAAIQLNPQHISSYTLTIEEKTMLGKWTRQGRFQAVSDDAAADQHDRLVDLLSAADFEHYEISNFARPGYKSRHNTSYWLGKKYLGIGPGAHSFDGATRQYNVRDNRKYIASLSRNETSATVEVLSTEDMLNEYLLISLRTSWGIDLKKLRRQFGVDLMLDRGSYIKSLENERLATVSGNSLVLTRKGLLLADEIALSLIPEGSQLKR
jgi:oxygen-independent coproporphyrinogen-3 oxidase